MATQVFARDLRHQITVRAPGTAEDALGQRVASWSNVCTVWAQVLPMQGRESEAGSAAQAQATVRFRIRHRAGITAAMQVVWQGLAHAIVGHPVDVDGRGHTLELHCTAGAPL